MKQFRFEPLHNARLQFECLAPAGWSAFDLSSSTPPSVMLAPNPSSPERIQIFLHDVERELDPARLLAARLEQSGSKILNLREVHSRGGFYADVIADRLVNGEVCRLRTTVNKDASRMFRIECIAPVSEFEALKTEFDAALGSFRLLQPEDRPVAEELRRFTEVSPVMFTCMHPASWVARKTPFRDGLTVHFQSSDGNRVLGIIWLDIATGPNPNPLRHRDALKRSGAMIDFDEAQVKVETPAAAIASSSKRGRVFDVGGGKWEIRCVETRISSAFSVGFGVLSMPREASADWWGVNMRAFELIVETFNVIGL
jgi:hypothetical protein